MKFNPTYIVYDVDKEGIKELIIKTDTCEADYIYEFYTYQNGLVLLGTAHEGHTGLHIPNNNNELSLRYSHLRVTCVMFLYIDLLLLKIK